MLPGGGDDFEAIVVGAGAAGLGAALRLAAAGMSLAVLEARGRAGGRAHTVTDGPFPLDLGCGWLHSADRNPWTRTAAGAGFTIDKTAPAWGTQSFDLGFSAEDQAGFAVAERRFHERLAGVAPNGADFSAAELLDPECRFNPLLNAVSTYVNSIASPCKTATVTPTAASTGASSKDMERPSRRKRRACRFAGAPSR